MKNDSNYDTSLKTWRAKDLATMVLVAAGILYNRERITGRKKDGIVTVTIHTKEPLTKMEKLSLRRDASYYGYRLELLTKEGE